MQASGNRVSEYHEENRCRKQIRCLGQAAALWLVLVSNCVSLGCAKWSREVPRKYTTVAPDPNADAEKAKKLNGEGLKKLKAGELDDAESLFREALAADVNYGPAHNNLGQIYLSRHQLYLAAWEFEFAANLMPERPECRVNLGLVYETADRLKLARDYYESALEISPNDSVALGNLARVSVKMDEEPGRVHYLLSELVMRDNRPKWLNWAKELMATRYRDAALPLDGYQSQSGAGTPSTGAEVNRSLPDDPQQYMLPVPEPVSPSDVKPIGSGETTLQVAPSLQLGNSSPTYAPTLLFPPQPIGNDPLLSLPRVPQLDAVQPAGFTGRVTPIP